MNSRATMTLLEAVFGIACFALVAFGPMVYVYFNGAFGMEFVSIDGEEEWKQRASARLEDQRSRQLRIREYGLDKRYTIHPLFGDARHLLFEDRDFASIESLLAAQFEKRSDPYEAYLYHRYIDELAYIHEDDPEQMLTIYNEWLVANPASYYALLLRGSLRVQYGWYYRGLSHISNVSWSSRDKFENEFYLARMDLNAARAINDRDTAPLVKLLHVAKVIGDDRRKIDWLYEKAIAIDPLSLSARIERLSAGLPKWRGSWNEIDAIVRECESLSDQFPLLGIVKRLSEVQMRDRSPAHKAALSTIGKEREWAEPYLAQLARNPGDPLLMTDAAYYLNEGRDFAKAEVLFRRLGENFHEVKSGTFRDVLHYNHIRGHVYAAVAAKNLRSTDGRLRAEEAMDIAPNHPYVNHIYGSMLMYRGDFAGAIPYYERAIEIDPTNLWTPICLAEVEEKLGRKTDALRRAVQLTELELSDSQMKRVQALIERNR